MATSTTISALIKSDHASIKQAYQKYGLTEDNLDEQERWANEFRWELARHIVAEELIVYPAFAKYLGTEAKKVVHQDRAEHQELKDLLRRLETTSVSDPDFSTTFDKLVDFFTYHIAGEEENDLPKLEKAITPEQSASLARSYDRTKMFVPTRSHPNAPNKPPFETVVGLLTAPLDKLQDLFDKFPENK